MLGSLAGRFGKGLISAGIGRDLTKTHVLGSILLLRHQSVSMNNILNLDQSPGMPPENLLARARTAEDAGECVCLFCDFRSAWVPTFCDRHRRVINDATRLIRMGNATQVQLIEALTLRGSAHLNAGNLRDAVKGSPLSV